MEGFGVAVGVLRVVGMRVAAAAAAAAAGSASSTESSTGSVGSNTGSKSNTGSIGCHSVISRSAYSSVRRRRSKIGDSSSRH